MIHRTLSALAIYAVIACAACAQGNLHRSEKYGFQIKAPSNWTSIPIASSEKWVIAKYLSDKDYRDKKEGYTHRPDMKVILFPDAITKERGAKVTKKGSTIIFRVKNPYRNFGEYMAANARGGNFLSDRSERKVNGIKVICEKWKFEKLTSKRTGIAWIFEGRDAKWAVYFEGLDDHLKKLEPLFVKSLKTFKFIQRKGSILEGRSSGDDGVEFDINDKKKKETPAQLKKKRAEKFDRQVRRASAALTKGWRIQKSKNFVAFTHVDKKYTKGILAQCEAVRKWMDKNFKFLKKGSPGRTIIRICKDSAEARAFTDTTGFASDIEIVTYKEVGMGGFGSGFINRAVVRKWFADKDRNYAWSIPGWLETGLLEVLGSADLKGSSLRLKPSIWEKTNMRELARDNKLANPRKIISASRDEFYKIDHAGSQAGAFVRFLLKGPKRHVSGFIPNYMKAVMEIGAEEEAREEAQRKAEAKEKKKEMSDEEAEAAEDARFKARSSKKDDRLANIFERAFGSWSDSQWKKFEASYKGFSG